MVCLFQFPSSVFDLFFLFIFDNVGWNFTGADIFHEGFQVVGRFFGDVGDEMRLSCMKWICMSRTEALQLFESHDFDFSSLVMF